MKPAIRLNPGIQQTGCQQAGWQPVNLMPRHNSRQQR